MDHDSLIQLLPQLLNKGSGKVVPVEAEGVGNARNWYEEQACSDQTSNQTQSDSEQSQTSSDQEDEPDGSDRDTNDQERLSPQPVDLDEIEKFLEGIAKPHTPRRAAGLPRDMANILREVDELGRRTLSSSALPGGGRPPPSPRRPAAPAPAPATGAASESALLRDGEPGRRVRISRSQQAASGEPASLAPRGGGGGKLSSSEPALGYTLQSLMSVEKKKYLNLTADMILLKQSSLENEILMKTQWEDHLRDLMAENSSLKLEVEKLRDRQPAVIEGHQSERARLQTLEHRVEEQNRLLDGFNAENARLYRELKQFKTERADLETVVDDLQCDRRLLKARLEAAQRAEPPPPAADGRQQRELRRRELELEQRWQEVQRAGAEVARLHELVGRRQASPCGRCRSVDSTPRMAAVACQTAAAASPPRSPSRSPSRPPARSPARPCTSPEHVAAAATAELQSLRATLALTEQRQQQELQAAAVREADLRRACDAKLRAAETRLRRQQTASPTRPDPELMAALRRLRAQMADKERALTQSRRQLEKSQRTVTGLQREREKLLVTVAARSPEVRGAEPRSRRGSVESRSQRASPARRDAAAAAVGAAALAGSCVDEALLSELQTAIAAVEEENVLLKNQLGQTKVNRDEEVARRNSQIAALRKENADIRDKLSGLPSASPAASEEEEAVFSARKDSLMLEMGSHMEAQEHVIVHLRETIRRFQEQTRLIASLEEENRSLRGTIDTLNWQVDSER